MLLSPNEIRKIAVFRALQLGDMLCSIPAIRALRHAYPDAEITLLGLPWAVSLVDRFPRYFNSFKHFPGYPGLPEQKCNHELFLWFLSHVQHQRYDLVLQMQGNGSIVNPMVELFGARYAAGFYLPEDYCPDEKLFMVYPNNIHEIERHLNLMAHLQIPSCGAELEFPLTVRDHEQLNALHMPIEPSEYVCVHPGSRGSWRQWPPEYFAALADHCAEKGFMTVLTGTEDELEIVEKVRGKMKSTPIVAAGKTTIGAVGVLIKNAFLLISNCTGVSHMAAALSTPSVVISMDGERQRWAPLDESLHKTVDWTKTPEFDLVLAQLLTILAKQNDHKRKSSATRA